MKPTPPPSDNQSAESRKQYEEEARKLQAEARKLQTEAGKLWVEARKQERELEKNKNELPPHIVSNKERQIAQIRKEAKTMEDNAGQMRQKAKQLVAPGKKFTQKDVLPPDWAPRRKPRVRLIS